MGFDAKVADRRRSYAGRAAMNVPCSPASPYRSGDRGARSMDSQARGRV